MIIAKELTLLFGEQTVFDHISFTINQDQRIGLVGRNGSGKTTLLKIIAGLQGFDSGKIEIQKGSKIAYMPQEVVLLSQKSVFDETISIFENLDQLIAESHEIEKILSADHKHGDPEKLERYAFLQDKLFELDHENKITQAKKILAGLGFTKEQCQSPVDNLSVGWKMRLVLAKLLLQKADFYLFDEPTNHLDLVAKDWFLDFLKNSNFGFVLVCHDRYFLDHLCEQIYEVSLGNLNIYRGNYSKYLEQKEHNEQLLEKKFVEQQKHIKKEEALIDRFRAKASKAKMVQSRIKALEKIELVKIEPKQKTLNFSLPEVKRSGKIVLDVKNLSFSFGDKRIFQNVSFQVERGQKVALVAPNGTGKTTLLSLIMGKYEIQHGKIIFGHNVESVLFEQDQNRSLNLDKSILQEVEDSCTDSETRMKVRTLLGAFLFSGDDVLKTIRVLSGGEKNRVAMAKVLLKNGNFLILDEPTNHLDIQSKEVLLEVLKSFSGTILFVSHDRDFLNHLATDILDLTAEGVFSYAGNYDSFLVQKQEQNKLTEQSVVTKVKISENENFSENKISYLKKKQIRNLEAKIARQEKELAELSVKFEKVEYGSEEYSKTFSRMKELEKLIAQDFVLWEELNR
jgi:ATP-binding cassette, subfamily F, member 3